MNNNFDECFVHTLKHEGGFVNDPRDPGGATNLGVTIGTLSQWFGRKATVAEVRNLTPTTVRPIYKANYWDMICGDALPRGLDFTVYDFAVNSGVKRAAMALQRAVGVADDGKIGRITLEAVALKETTFLITAVNADRLAFLRRLSTWPTFGKGWGSRVSGTKNLSFAMLPDTSHTA